MKRVDKKQNILNLGFSCFGINDTHLKQFDPILVKHISENPGTLAYCTVKTEFVTGKNLAERQCYHASSHMHDELVSKAGELGMPLAAMRLVERDKK